MSAPNASPVPAPSAPPDDDKPLEHSEMSCLRIAAGLHHRLLKGDFREILAEISRFRHKGEVRAYARRIEAQLLARKKRSRAKAGARGRKPMSAKKRP